MKKEWKKPELIILDINKETDFIIGEKNIPGIFAS